MLRHTSLASNRLARTTTRVVVPKHIAPAVATLLGPQPRRWLMVQEPGTRDRPNYERAFGDSVKMGKAEDKYEPRMEADMSEEEKKHAQEAQQQQGTETKKKGSKGKEKEQEERESAAFQSDSKEEQHTTADPNMGGAGTGTGTGAGGSETGGSTKKPTKKKAEGTKAGGKGAGVESEKKSGTSPIKGHPGESGYVRREEGLKYGPDA